MLVRGSAVFAAMAWGAMAASAADTTTISPNGVVLINRGNGFERVHEATQLHPGDMVMVNEGSAQLACADGSAGALQPGQVYTVGSSNCGNLPTDAGPPGDPGAEALVETGAEAGGLAGVAGIGGMSTTTLVVGGVAIAAGVGVAASAAANKKKKNQASP